MNKKILIVIIAVVVAICIIVGVAEIVNSAKTEENVTESTIEIDEDSTEIYDALEDTEKTTAKNDEEKSSSETNSKDDKTSAEADKNSDESAETSAGSSPASTKTESKKNTTENSAAVKSEKETTKATTTAAATTKNASTQAKTTKKNASTSAKTTEAKSSTTLEKVTLSVTISISCKNALEYVSSLPSSGYLLKNTKYKIDSGSSVFDLLQKACSDNSISLTYQSKYYIQGIGGLNEKDCSSSSGWMYKVNGTTPTKAACNYTLADGDAIEWYYVVNSSDR